MNSVLSLRAAGLLLCLTMVFNLPDEDFMVKASQANVAEVAAAKMAISKSSSGFVKKFAGQMVSDHSTAQKELVALAKKKGINLPQEPDTEHKATADQLSALSGAAFDSAYMKAQVIDHNVAVSLFTAESTSGSDNEAKAYASKYLPKLKHHLMMTGMKKEGGM